MDAIRELVSIGHAHAGTRDVQFAATIEQVHLRLADVSDSVGQLAGLIAETNDAVLEISSSLVAMNDAFAKVWVESLMANRLLLDAHNRGLIERVRDMTSRYLERSGKR